eukprot:3284632-Amphidinium_carterae.1
MMTMTTTMTTMYDMWLPRPQAWIVQNVTDIEFYRTVTPFRPGLATPEVHFDFLATFRPAYFIRFLKSTLTVLRTCAHLIEFVSFRLQQAKHHGVETGKSIRICAPGVLGCKGGSHNCRSRL